MDNEKEIFTNCQQVETIGQFTIYKPSDYAISNFGRIKNIKTNEIITNYTFNNNSIQPCFLYHKLFK